MTMGELADVWLAHRQKHGKARSAGPLRQQSLAAYNATVRHQIKPLMGEVQLREITVSYLDGTLARLESGEGTGKKGRSSAQIRSVLGQMFGLAIRHGALVSNPMDLVATTSRPRQRAGGVDVLEATDLHRLLHVVDREVRRVPGRVRPYFLLQDVVATLIGTGARDGEVLALRWCDVDLQSDVPTVRIRGTLVESRKGYVEKTFRQDETKTASERLLAIPPDLVEVLKARQERIAQPVDPETPVFATGKGGWPEPSNIRTGLRVATKDVTGLAGTSPHVIRRSVATHLELTRGLDAARRQMGHSDPSVTYQRYVVRTAALVDNRDSLVALFDRGSDSSDSPDESA